MWRMSFVAASMAVIFGLSAMAACPSATACSCLRRSAQDRFDSSTAVFTGEVVAMKQGDPVVWTFAVEKVRKGKVGRTIEIDVPAYYLEGCGFVFEVGARYEVFSYAFNGRLLTDNCAGTRPLKAAVGAPPVGAGRGSETGSGAGAADPRGASEDAAAIAGAQAGDQPGDAAETGQTSEPDADPRKASPAGVAPSHLHPDGFQHVHVSADGESIAAGERALESRGGVHDAARAAAAAAVAAGLVILFRQRRRGRRAD